MWSAVLRTSPFLFLCIGLASAQEVPPLSELASFPAESWGERFAWLLVVFLFGLAADEIKEWRRRRSDARPGRSPGQNDQAVSVEDKP